jgi:hypothetical protein
MCWQEVGGGNSGSLTGGDFRGCRWIEGGPRPLRRCMFCGRPVPEGESWNAGHRGAVFGAPFWWELRDEHRYP